MVGKIAEYVMAEYSFTSLLCPRWVSSVIVETPFRWKVANLISQVRSCTSKIFCAKLGVH